MNTVATKTRIALKNILFATDFSPAAEAALPYAIGRRMTAKLLHPGLACSRACRYSNIARRARNVQSGVGHLHRCLSRRSSQGPSNRVGIGKVGRPLTIRKMPHNWDSRILV